jgi:hypothetical protein
MRCFALFMIALFFSQPVHSQEWTRFHGPNGQGVAKLKTFVSTWSEKETLFKVALPGIGHSSPVVWGEKVFLLSADPTTAERHILCL